MLVLFLSLLLLAYSRRLTFSAVGDGSNMITDFIDPFSYMANHSTVLTDQQREWMLIYANISAGWFGFPLTNCVLDHRSSISTCDRGVVLYPYYIKQTTQEDTDHPERVGVWIAEEYGWMSILPPGSRGTLAISALTVYHPVDMSTYEVFSLCGQTPCEGPDRSVFTYTVAGDTWSWGCGLGNYTLSNDAWYVTMTYRLY